MTQKEVIVFSHTPLAGLGANMRCFSGEVSSLITRLQANEGKNIWLFGGGDLIDQVVCSDLVDQIRLVTLPLNLTKGDRLVQYNSSGSQSQFTKSRDKIRNVIFDLV